MGFFNSGLFWFVEGVLACLVILGLKTWAEDNELPMPWWKWIAASAWMLFLGFSIAFVFTSLGENEPTAARLGGLIFGILSIIFGVGVWRVLLLGRRSVTENESSG